MIKDGRRMIYVAGAYSGANVLEVFDNMRIGMSSAAELFRQGFSPFCPWHDYHYCLETPMSMLTVEMFYQYSMDFLRKCDALYLVPNPRNGNSKGTQKEIDEAKRLGLKIFDNMDDLLQWANS